MNEALLRSSGRKWRTETNKNIYCFKPLKQGSPPFLTPGTSFMESNFSMNQGMGGGLGMIQAHYIYCAFYFCWHYISSTSDHQALDPRGGDLCILRSANVWGQECRLGVGARGEETCRGENHCPKATGSLPSGETAQKTCPFTIPGWLLKRQKPKTWAAPAGRFS